MEQHLNNAILFFNDNKKFPRRRDVRNELVNFFESDLRIEHGPPTVYKDFETLSSKVIQHLLDTEESTSSSTGYKTSHFSGKNDSIGFIVELTSKDYLRFERFITITYRTSKGEFKAYNGSYEHLLIQMHRRCLADAYKI